MINCSGIFLGGQWNGSYPHYQAICDRSTDLTVLPDELKMRDVAAKPPSFSGSGPDAVDDMLTTLNATVND